MWRKHVGICKTIRKRAMEYISTVDELLEKQARYLRASKGSEEHIDQNGKKYVQHHIQSYTDRRTDIWDCWSQLDRGRKSSDIHYV